MATLESSPFNLKEKIDYYKRKWTKDHISIVIISAFFWILVIVALTVEKLNIITIISIACMFATFVYVIMYNLMMKYVEENAYKKIEEYLSSKSTK